MRHSHSVAKGPTLIEKMEARLLRACRRYVRMQNELTPRDRIILRGRIRGMAEMLVIFTGPWEFSERDMIAALEEEFMERARE